jgi:predicted DNA-binding transcriptional regulator AlpA
LDLPKEGYARPAQVAFAFGVGQATIHNWMNKGDFPKAQKLGVRITVWPVEIIRRELDAR